MSLLDYRDNFSEYSSVFSNLIIIGASFEKSPCISIMIPTFRRPELLRESIRSALDQNIQIPFEVVVVDNEPRSEFSTVVDQVILDFDAPNLRLFRNSENIGMFGNWNRCIELARGRWVTILNDDDLLSQDYLSACMGEIGKYPEISMISCDLIIKDDRTSIPNKPGIIRRFLRALKLKCYENKERGRSRKLLLSKYFCNNPHLGSLGILMRRDIALSLGGFWPAMYPSADYLFFTRSAMTYGSYRMAKSLAVYRVSQNESQKEEVIVGWMEKDMKIRGAIASWLGGSNSILLKFYIKLAAIDTIRSGFQFWNRALQTQVILSRAGLNNYPVNYIRRILGVLIVKFYTFDRNDFVS